MACQSINIEKYLDLKNTIVEDMKIIDQILCTQFRKFDNSDTETE